MGFSIGDVVIVTDEADRIYAVTGKNWIGKVVGYNNKRILVQGMFRDDLSEFSVNPEYFALYPFFPQDISLNELP